MSYYPSPPPPPPPRHQPAYAQRPVAPHPHPEPRTYPLMLRTWEYQVWKPIVGLGMLLLGVMVLAPLLLLPILAVGVAIESDGPFLEAFESALTMESVTASGMLYLNLSLASAIPVTWLIMRVLHRMRPRWLTSVLPGMRWKFFAACIGLAVVALVAQVVVSLLLPQDPNEISGAVNELTPHLLAIGVVILLTTPLQAMGEEYAFRGYAMQAFGSLTKSPWFGILLTSVLFALAHGVQNAPLFLDRFIFGLMAGYVVLRTGGLEAGIAMHIWNNLVAFGFALAFTDIDSALTVTEVSWWQLPLTLTQNGVFLVLVLLVARKMGISDRTSPPSPPSSGQPVFEDQSPAV